MAARRGLGEMLRCWRSGVELGRRGQQVCRAARAVAAAVLTSRCSRPPFSLRVGWPPCKCAWQLHTRVCAAMCCNAAQRSSTVFGFGRLRRPTCTLCRPACTCAAIECGAPVPCPEVPGSAQTTLQQPVDSSSKPGRPSQSHTRHTQRTNGALRGGGERSVARRRCSPRLPCATTAHSCALPAHFTTAQVLIGARAQRSVRGV